MSTITRHVQVESFRGTIKVIGDRDLVTEFKEKVDGALFGIVSAGYGSVMMLKITLRQQPKPGQHAFEYELPKMQIIHILEDEGFKVVVSLSKVIFQNFFEIFQKSVLDILDIVVSEYVVRLMKFSLNMFEKCV